MATAACSKGAAEGEVGSALQVRHARRCSVTGVCGSTRRATRGYSNATFSYEAEWCGS